MSNGKTLRVLHLGSPTGMYGAERWILALVRHLPRDRVHSVVGVIKDAQGGEVPALCQHADALGFQTQVFEAPGKVNLDAVRQIREFIAEHSIDIVHTHGYKTDIAGALAARGTPCRMLATPHGWSTNAGLKIQVYELLDRLVFFFCDAVAPLSADLYDGLRRIPGLSGKVRLILNGVDVTEIDAVAEPSPETAAWKEQGDLVVGYIGQLIPRKGIATLIDAFEQMELPGKRLCIVGDGPQRAELEALASETSVADRIHFFGYRPDRIALLKSFDVFVLPSSLEGIPRCLMEAMAAGVAVVASDIPGCADIVTPERNGLLFPYGSDASLAAAIQRLSDIEVRERFGAAGRELVLKRYSGSRMAADYVELYDSLIAGRNSAANPAATSAE